MMKLKDLLINFEYTVQGNLDTEISDIIYDIPDVISKCMSGAEFVATPTLDDIFATNDEIYRRAAEMCVEKSI